MADFGFTPTKITASDLHAGIAIFSDIHLDQKGFSTIDNIVAKGSITGIESATIDHLILTGVTKNWGIPSISGWEWPKKDLPGKIKLKALDFKNTQLDLMTPEGALRFNSDAQMTLQPDGSQKISGILHSKQNQLVLDTQWNAIMRSRNRGWTIAAEIREARINFEKLGISRTSGWLNIDGEKKTGLPLFSGQLSAGQLKFGKNTALSNINLTIDNVNGVHSLILQANVASYKNMRLTADVRDIPAAPTIEATIETKSLRDLIAFIASLQKDLETSEKSNFFLTSLLITPGNLERLERQIRRARYDTLALTVTGAPYDLVGKIVARHKKNGTVRQHVISLDPG